MTVVHGNHIASWTSVSTFVPLPQDKWKSQLISWWAVGVTIWSGTCLAHGKTRHRSGKRLSTMFFTSAWHGTQAVLSNFLKGCLAQNAMLPSLTLFAPTCKTLSTVGNLKGSGPHSPSQALLVGNLKGNYPHSPCCMKSLEGILGGSGPHSPSRTSPVGNF